MIIYVTCLISLLLPAHPHRDPSDRHVTRKGGQKKFPHVYIQQNIELYPSNTSNFDVTHVSIKLFKGGGGSRGRSDSQSTGCHLLLLLKPRTDTLWKSTKYVHRVTEQNQTQSPGCTWGPPILRGTIYVVVQMGAYLRMKGDIRTNEQIFIN